SGPLLAAFVVVPRGQSSIAWFGLAALMAIVVLLQVCAWYARQRAPRRPGVVAAARETMRESAPSRGRVAMAIGILVMLLFSKNVYSSSLSSYYTLYLIDRFHLSVPTAQLYLFAFMVGIVIGTITGGALADRVGRIPVMWFSIVGA